MAYIARLRTVQIAVPTCAAASAAALVPARGDKWYIDPEEVRQYDAPFHVAFGMAFPTSFGPNKEHMVFMNNNSAYPRMPFYHRQLRNSNLKWDFGEGQRRNYGETYHILEEWLLPSFNEWSTDNGCQNSAAGTVDYLVMFLSIYLMYVCLNYLDFNYCWQWLAPKQYPYENLWVEQGGNELVPIEHRPYTNHRLMQVAPDCGLQK